MDKFKRPARAPEAPAPGYKEMFMDLDCTTCDEEVEMARYYAGERILVWECSKNHRSFIEGIEF